MAGDGYGPGTLTEVSETGDSSQITWSTQALNIYAVQCFRCGKYRRVPETRKYEEIREHILHSPWECAFTSEWTSAGMNCDVRDEFTSPEFILIFDRPAIPASPDRWERKCFLRRECSTNFADIYYYPPNGGLRLKTKRELSRYWEKFPGSLPPDFDVSRRISFAQPRPPPGLWTKKRPRMESTLQMRGQLSKKVVLDRTANEDTGNMMEMANEEEQDELYECENVKALACRGEDAAEALFTYADFSAAPPLLTCEQSRMTEFSSDEDQSDYPVSEAYESPKSPQVSSCSTLVKNLRGIRSEHFVETLAGL